MSDASFSDLLSKPVDSFKRPLPVPAGSYLATVGQFKLDKSKQKQTPYVQFPITPIQPLDDVSADELTAAQESWGEKSLRDKPFLSDFYLTPEAMWRLGEFLRDKLGIEANGRPTQELLAEAVGMQVMVMVTHTQSQKDPETVYANIQSFGKVEE